MIAELLRAYRWKNEITLRTLAKELNLSPATLSRIENGKPGDQQTMLKLINWLFETPEDI